jgi:hypothetical protein
MPWKLQKGGAVLVAFTLDREAVIDMIPSLHHIQEALPQWTALSRPHESFRISNDD